MIDTLKLLFLRVSQLWMYRISARVGFVDVNKCYKQFNQVLMAENTIFAACASSGYVRFYWHNCIVYIM